MARARKANAMPQRRARRKSVTMTSVGGRERQQRRRKFKMMFRIVMVPCGGRGDG